MYVDYDHCDPSVLLLAVKELFEQDAREMGFPRAGHRQYREVLLEQTRHGHLRRDIMVLYGSEIKSIVLETQERAEHGGVSALHICARRRRGERTLESSLIEYTQDLHIADDVFP